MHERFPVYPYALIYLLVLRGRRLLHIGSITGGLSSITLILHNGNAVANMGPPNAPEMNAATMARSSRNRLLRFVGIYMHL